MKVSSPPYTYIITEYTPFAMYIIYTLCDVSLCNLPVDYTLYKMYNVIKIKEGEQNKAIYL